MRLFTISLIVCGIGINLALNVFQPSTAFADTPSPAEQQFLSWLQTFQSEKTSVKTGKISFDQASNTLIIEDFSISNVIGKQDNSSQLKINNLNTKIKTLKIKAFSKKNDLSFESASVDSLSIVDSGAPAGSGLVLDHADIGSFSLPDLQQFTADPLKPVTSQAGFLRLLSKATIKDANIGHIRFDQAFQLDSIVIGHIADGKIDDLGLKGLSSSYVAETNDPPQTVSFDALVLKDINLDTYISMFEMAPYLTSGVAHPWNILLRQADVSGVKYQKGPIALAVGKITLGPLKLRLFDQNITALLDKAALDPEYGTKNPADAKLIALSLQNSIMLDLASISNLDVTAPDKSGMAHASLGQFSLANLSAEKLEQIALETFKVSDPDGSIAIGRAMLGNITLPQGDNLPYMPSWLLPQVHQVHLGDVFAASQQITFALGQLDLDLGYYVNNTPSNIKANLQHLKFATDQIGNPGLRQTASDLGYSSLDLSFELSCAWQDANSELSFDKIALSGADMGALVLSGSLTGISRASFESPASNLAQEIMAGGLKNLKISYKEDGLLNRFLAQIAKQNNKTPNDLKKILSTSIPNIMGQISDPAIRNKFIFAAIAFLNDPKILEISATSGSSVPISSIIEAIKNPVKLPTTLKLDASANRRG